MVGSLGRIFTYISDVPVLEGERQCLCLRLLSYVVAGTGFEPVISSL